MHTRPQHEGGTPRAPSRFVRYLAVKKRPHQIVVSGYGISKAGDEWDAISEVKGKAVFVDAGFEAGQVMPQGRLLLRLDPYDYELAIQQIEAQVRVRGQELKEIEQQSENLVELIGLSKSQVELVEKNFKRQKDLEGSDAFMEVKLDEAKNALVGQKLALQELQNQQALLPVRKAQLQAALELAQAQLEEARRNLARTEIHLPFNARCLERTIKPNQFANAGVVRSGPRHARDALEGRGGR